MTEIERATCHDCGAKEGQLHVLGCDMESCPFCGHQLLCCIHGMGCDEALKEDWEKSKKRIPFILYPNLCAKCGVLWPEMFSVPDAEWKRYVEPRMRDKMLCEACYAHIRACVDRHSCRRAKKYHRRGTLTLEEKYAAAMAEKQIRG
jgi:hypothetical protein